MAALYYQAPGLSGLGGFCAAGLVAVDVGADNAICVTPEEAQALVSAGTGTIVAPGSMGSVNVNAGPPDEHSIQAILSSPMVLIGAALIVGVMVLGGRRR